MYFLYTCVYVYMYVYFSPLLRFPSQIELLHNLPVPMVTTPVDPPLSSEPTDYTSMASSLYDWISTHVSLSL